MTDKKTLRDYLLEGGIKDREFIKEGPKSGEYTIYKVRNICGYALIVDDQEIRSKGGLNLDLREEHTYEILNCLDDKEYKK